MGKTKTAGKKKYDHKNARELVRDRAEINLGSMELEKYKMYLCAPADRDPGQPEIISQEVEFVAAFFKIVDEVLVNARDQCVRTREDTEENQLHPDPCTQIKIWADQESGQITVHNNGTGVSVYLDEDQLDEAGEPMWSVTMVFGLLGTSENYDDDQKRIVGGKNGLGVKLANVMSEEFEVETFDAVNGQLFSQKFHTNMEFAEPPEITKKRGKKGYTQVTFTPDYKRFQMKGITDDVYYLLQRRAYDLAYFPGLKIWFNDELCKVASFEKYVLMHYPPAPGKLGVKKVIDETNERWKVAVVFDPNRVSQVECVSFVNGINTYRGGSHVAHVWAPLVKRIQEKIQGTAKKHQDVKVTVGMLRKHLALFVDATIENPNFTSQAKEQLTTKVANFGSRFQPSEKFFTDLWKTGIVKHLINAIEGKNTAKLEKDTGTKRKYRNKKLHEAHDADKRDGSCTLILTEGDSALTLAVAGMAVCGKQKYGAFPMKGKALNVRNKTFAKIKENEEVCAIAAIIGLPMLNPESREPRPAIDRNKLRYSNILIMADQDVDGAHIKGLIMNMIHFLWPELVSNGDDGFIRVLNTPLLKLTWCGPKRLAPKQKQISFQSAEEHRLWAQDQDLSHWKTKYYKGLGSSGSKEAREYFKDLESSIVTMQWLADEECCADPEFYTPVITDDICLDAMILAFSKVDKQSDRRKLWLNSFNNTQFVSSADKMISYNKFVHYELIAFSVASCIRAIPNVMDGFKESQRKVLFGCFKKNLTGEVKVAQLAGYIGEHAEYHHGEASLHGTIINMAQDYTGSGNNINLLQPEGMFGTRLQGGKDSASPRYIFTLLASLTRTIFSPLDEPVLEQQMEDGRAIEPKYYAPGVCMALINNTRGMGTGYSSDIPCFNPVDVIANTRRYLNGKRLKSMVPWYRGFDGAIEEYHSKTGKGWGYQLWAAFSTEDDILQVDDLPPGIWNMPFLGHLQALQDLGSLSDAAVAVKGFKYPKGFKSEHRQIGKAIKTVIDNSTEMVVNIAIHFQPGTLENYNTEKLDALLKLSTQISMCNMHMFTAEGKIHKYTSPQEILTDHADTKLVIYAARKKHLLRHLRNEIHFLDWKAKFIQMVNDDEIKVAKMLKSKVIEQLVEHGFPELSRTDAKPSYQYLLSISIDKFTKDEYQSLRNDVAMKQAQAKELKRQTPSDLWMADLDQIEAAYLAWDAADLAARTHLNEMGQTKTRKPRAKKAK